VFFVPGLAAVPPRPAGTVTVTVPEVVTTASDGLPALLVAGLHRWSVLVLLTSGAAPRTAWLAVNGESCPPVELLPGRAVRVACTAWVPARRTTAVTLQTAGGVVARWQHSAR
jgi:hypothetical protein